MLPTDPRFLSLRPWECEQEFWAEVIAQRERKRALDGKDDPDFKPAERVEDLFVEEDFDRKAAAMIEQWAREAESKRAPAQMERVETEPVIDLTTGSVA